MIFSYNWLKQYIKGKMPGPKELVELLMFHSFEIEGLDKKANDFLIDIDVLPNRAHDCLSYIGVSRDIAAITGLELKIPEAKFKESKQEASDFITIDVKDSNDCPRYSSKVITGIKVGTSPKWMSERLEACGLKTINNIVDAINYVMLETGQPMHSFDVDKLGKNIIIRKARKGEAMEALDDKEYKLNENILVIADSKKPIAIAGIKGGESTGIDKQTKNIVVEAANFDSILTRKASRELKLRTDASLRFEQGIDPNLIDFAQQRVCALIQEIAGGEVASGMVDVYPKKVVPKKIKLDIDYVNNLLGVDIPKQKIIKILKSLEFGVSGTGREIIVTVPTRRLDVSIPEDLVEEIGRVYGYENIPSVFPTASLQPPERNDNLFWENNIKDILQQAGLYETYGYSFIGENDKAVFNYGENDLAEIENPISSLNKYLRPSLIPNLLKSTKENLKNLDEIMMFEIGSIFNKKKGFAEKRMLTCILTGKNIKNDGFYILKGIINDLFNKLGISDIWYDNVKPTPEDSALDIWHPGKTAEIKVLGKEIGFLGQLHPQVSGGIGVKENVFIADIDLKELLNVASEENEYEQISAYPAVLRDISLLVPVGTKTVDILNIINSAESKLVKDVDLFDTYKGQGVPENKENFSFHIVYQSNEKTLKSSDVDEIHQNIIIELEKNPDWEIRK